MKINYKNGFFSLFLLITNGVSAGGFIVNLDPNLPSIYQNPLEVTKKYYWSGGSGESTFKIGELPVYYKDSLISGGNSHSDSKLGVWYDLILPEGGLWVFKDAHGTERYIFHVPAHDYNWQATIIKKDKPLARQLWGKNQLS